MLLMSKDSPVFSHQVPHELSSSLRDEKKLDEQERSLGAEVFIKGFMQEGWGGESRGRQTLVVIENAGRNCVCCSQD